MQWRTRAFKVGSWLAGGCVAALLAVGVCLWMGKGEGQRIEDRGSRIEDRDGAAAARMEDGKTRMEDRGLRIEKPEVAALRPLPRSGGAAAGPTRARATTIGEREKQGRPRYRREPAAPGQRVTARVQVGGRAYDLTPNQVGNFQRVYLQPSETIPVEVAYEQGKAGERVAVSAEDGGGVWQGVSGKGEGARGKGAGGFVAALDGQQKVAFEFQATEHRGIHRVVLRKGNDVKVLDFWVGQELPVAGR